jgi:hypothetical protein
MSMSDKAEKTKGDLPTTDGMFFETFQLVPEENITGPELVAILTALQINFSKAILEQLPERARRHFIRITRDGKKERWNKRMK